ncbi:chitinase [Pseudozyma hubeiensis SY62]|uniref:Chitinase n=1 Tax=Pseudozyma hubeiensis (strain SY62) TaxID=1305764 RepID=R9P5S9_PSEHS|nr:chitinase [Pseudozyma hubeiensis SY62]GAC93450.1 chitinase [Pseudozyma hubeiensis SY62]
MRLASCIRIGFGVVSATLGPSINPTCHSGSIAKEGRAGGDSRKRNLDGQHRGNSQVADDITMEDDLSTPLNHSSPSDQTPLSSDAGSSLPSSTDSSSSSSSDPLSPSTSHADADNNPGSSGSSYTNPLSLAAGISSSPIASTTTTTPSNSTALPTVTLGYPPIPTASNLDQGGLNSTLSNTSPTQNPPSSGTSSSRTKSIAVGVTVPMITIAIGLIAFWVLVKRRRRGRERDAEKADDRNVDGNETPGAETQANTETKEAELIFGSLEQDIKPTDRVREVQDRGGSDEGSHASRSTVRFRVDEAKAANLPNEQVPVSPSIAQVPLPQGGGGNDMLATGTPNITRVRSKRKPVPKLVETTAEAHETHPDVKR